MEAVGQVEIKWKSTKMSQFGNTIDLTMQKSRVHGQNKEVLIETSLHSSTMSAPTLVINPYYVVVIHEYNKINTRREG